MATLDEVKRRLAVSWEDPETDARVGELAESVALSLSYLLGCSPWEAQNDGRLKQLYLNACLYEWNNVYDQFRENYRGDIMELRRLFYAD